jgi:hypothetical protein
MLSFLIGLVRGMLDLRLGFPPTNVGFNSTRKIHVVFKICLSLSVTRCDLRTEDRARCLLDPFLGWRLMARNKSNHLVPRSANVKWSTLRVIIRRHVPPKTSRTTSTRTPSHSQSSAGPSSTAAGGRSFARTPSWTQPSPSSQRSRTTQVPPWTPPRQHSQAERDAWLQEEDNDIFENVASSQAPPVSHEQYQKYGSLDTKCVGVRFYTGFATIGERITIKREPTNPYDSNASKLLKEQSCKSFTKLESSNRQHGERANRSHRKVHHHNICCFVRTAY